MTKDEAIKILSLHLMQCGMMMPVGWLNNHGEGSDFLKAYEMAMDALKNEPVRCKDCAWSMRDDDVYYCINPDGLDNYAKPDDFCSYGERREGE